MGESFQSVGDSVKETWGRQKISWGIGEWIKGGKQKILVGMLSMSVLLRGVLITRLGASECQFCKKMLESSNQTTTSKLLQAIRGGP